MGAEDDVIRAAREWALPDTGSAKGRVLRHHAAGYRALPDIPS